MNSPCGTQWRDFSASAKFWHGQPGSTSVESSQLNTLMGCANQLQWGRRLRFAQTECLTRACPDEGLNLPDLVAGEGVEAGHAGFEKGAAADYRIQGIEAEGEARLAQVRGESAAEEV